MEGPAAWRLTATVPGYMTSLHHSLSNDGRKVVTIDRSDHTIRIFEVPSGACSYRCGDIKGGSSRRSSPRTAEQ